MSTLCRAGRKCRNVRGARPSRSLGGASRAALPDKDVFGGTPNTARETHALPTHLSAFLKCRIKRGRKISDNPKNFGNISEKQPFSEIISDYFLETLCRVRCSQTGSSLPSFMSLQVVESPVKPGQTKSNRCRWSNLGQIICKCFNMNGLQNKQPLVQSNPVKLGQTDCKPC